MKIVSKFKQQVTNHIMLSSKGVSIKNVFELLKISKGPQENLTTKAKKPNIFI